MNNYFVPVESKNKVLASVCSFWLAEGVKIQFYVVIVVVVSWYQASNTGKKALKSNV